VRADEADIDHPNSATLRGDGSRSAVDDRLSAMPDRNNSKPPGLSEERAPRPELEKADETPDALSRLQRAIREGIEQLDRGDGIPGSKVIEELRRRVG
jgi:hypothetical protein